MFCFAFPVRTLCRPHSAYRYIRTVSSWRLLSAWPNWLKHICGPFGQRHMHCTNETSRNKSSFFAISAFVLASTAVAGCCRTKHQLMYILLYIHACITMYTSWCVNRVTFFKLLVYSVNNTRRPLLYVISLCTALCTHDFCPDQPGRIRMYH